MVDLRLMQIRPAVVVNEPRRVDLSDCGKQFSNIRWFGFNWDFVVLRFCD